MMTSYPFVYEIGQLRKYIYTSSYACIYKFTVTSSPLHLNI